ncbi:molybdate ABC transporter substrate-binding protein [Vibrio sp. TH_r3]|uniref:molybdate ABC transporter substrate-binding protein n=1 Tax=Vibrio sp. TH_r3 TaxID=3082084 RepID=UPI002955305D|nr:molybdate ABC transporter substrate-binding protein [Vibrio sp. TH_r3]MDV7103548.1 molybdate ABC transporter substrate-binding protein [Vibrio sp. TH_r3]
MSKQITLLLMWACLALNAKAAETRINIYAAASMTNVISQLAEDYSQKTGTQVVTIFAGSSSLARQIQNGAPADIFISANNKWVDYLVEKDVITKEHVQKLVENELILVSPSSRPVDEFDLSDADQWRELLTHERLALGQTESVPAGIYAKESLINLGVWQQINNRIAPTNSVRSALALVERGEAGVGIVYKTDTFQNDKVKLVADFASSLHQPIIYPLALLNDQPEVRAFAQYLLSDEAKQVFGQFGFY